MFESTTSQRRTAAALAAAAFFEVLPNSELLGGGETPSGFFYQVNCSAQPVPETLRMLEERMRQIVREKRACKALEMVAASASGLFAKRGHLAAVEALAECPPKALVSLFQIGDFYELAEGPFCSSLAELGVFALVSFERVEERLYRLEGCIAPSKDELKALLRRRTEYARSNAQVLGQELGLWEESGVWRQRGLRLKRLVLAHLAKSCVGEEIAIPEDALPPKSFEAFWRYTDRVAGPFDEEWQSTLEQTIYSSNATSLLQLVEPSLRMLGFLPVLREDCWWVDDGLGVPQVVARATRTSVTLSLEKILGLLLEKSAGNLPKWLMPEHIRLVPLEPQHGELAREFASSLEAAGHRVGFAREGSLKNRVAAAKRERVPFVLVLGDRELAEKKGALRRPEEERAESVDLRELIERLNEN